MWEESGWRGIQCTAVTEFGIRTTTEQGQEFFATLSLLTESDLGTENSALSCLSLCGCGYPEGTQYEMLCCYLRAEMSDHSPVRSCINHIVLTVNVKYHPNPNQAWSAKNCQSANPGETVINKASKATEEVSGIYKPPINRANMNVSFDRATET